MITLLIKPAIAALTAFTAYEDHQPLPEPTAEVVIVTPVEVPK